MKIRSQISHNLLFNYIKYFFLLLLLVHACTGRFIKEKDEYDIQNLINLYESSNWLDRNSAISQACIVKSTAAVDLLIKALYDRHPANRIQALECLGLRTEKKAKKDIKIIAESETETNVRLKAIQALARYKDPTAAPVFAKGLSHEDWLIREESIKGILLIKGPFIEQVSVPYVLKALHDPRINVRLTTLRFLEIKDQRIYRELSEIINNKKNLYKINLLKACLKAINGYMLDRKTKDTLINEFLTHQNRNIRVLSLNVLKKDRELLDSDDIMSLPERITGRKRKD